MGIIDDDQRRAVAPQMLHAPRRGFHVGEKPQCGFQRDAADQQDAEHAEKVRGIECADQTGVDLALSPWRFDGEDEA